MTDEPVDFWGGPHDGQTDQATPHDCPYHGKEWPPTMRATEVEAFGGMPAGTLSSLYLWNPDTCRYEWFTDTLALIEQPARRPIGWPLDTGCLATAEGMPLLDGGDHIHRCRLTTQAHPGAHECRCGQLF